MGSRSGRARRCRVAARRRVGRADGACHQPLGLSIVRPGVPRPRRGHRPARTARRDGVLARAALQRVTDTTRTGRRGADEKLQRMLALVPWVAARDGPTLTEVCERFGCTEAELVADLDRLFM